MSQLNWPAVGFSGSPRIVALGPYDYIEDYTDGEDYGHMSSSPSQIFVESSTSEEEMAEDDERGPESSDESRPPSPALLPATSAEQEGAETCPVCLDVWANSGPHRLVALKCGHLFGHSCILKWLNALPAKSRNCPSCKTKASVKHIRFLFARKLIAADTSQITAMEREIQDLQSQKSKAEQSLRESQIAHKSCLLRLKEMKARVFRAENMETKNWKFCFEKGLELNKEGGCRVLCYNSRTYEFYVSQRSPNPLFPGFGVRKVSAVDYKLGHFQHLHTKSIRDLSYNESRDTLLSVSLDGTVRVTQCAMPSACSTVLSTGCTGTALWTCTWSNCSDAVLYVGGARGLLVYDLRQASVPVTQGKYKFDPSPVVSVQMTLRGLLVCQLNTLCLFADNEMKPLNVEGPFTNVCYDAESERVLVSCRPSSTSRARHIVCTLNEEEDSLDIVNTYHGSSRATVMSRSCLVSAGNSTWAAAYSESDSQLQLYGIQAARGLALQSNPLSDVCGVRTAGGTVLATLGDTSVNMYKAVAF